MPHATEFVGFYKRKRRAHARLSRDLDRD